MKIPNYVRDNQKALHDGVPLLRGEIRYNSSEILLSDISGHQMKCITLWHEILHGIIESSGLEIENEEAVVEQLSRWIYQVLQDNAAKLVDLKGAELTGRNKCRKNNTKEKVQ